MVKQRVEEELLEYLFKRYIREHNEKSGQWIVKKKNPMRRGDIKNTDEIDI